MKLNCAICGKEMDVDIDKEMFEMHEREGDLVLCYDCTVQMMIAKYKRLETVN